MRRVRKNLRKVYIVHPSAYSKAVLLFMRSFTSGKLKKKIIEVYNWKDLTESIALNDIMLPETSRDYVTTAYKVVKINAKGKRQRRYAWSIALLLRSVRTQRPLKR
jgi:hypothetical protein